jgi:hypothetical protein
MYCRCGNGHVAVVGSQQLFTHCAAEAATGNRKERLDELRRAVRARLPWKTLLRDLLGNVVIYRPSTSSLTMVMHQHYRCHHW